MLKIYKKNDMKQEYVYPMHPARVLNQFILSVSIDFSLQAEISEDISLSFNNILITDTSIDAVTLCKVLYRPYQDSRCEQVWSSLRR